jgi:hypothetical protein
MTTPLIETLGRKRDVRQGDYFLLPLAGRHKDLLVRAEQEFYYGHWVCSHADGFESVYLLSSCKRIHPSDANRILGKKIARPKRLYRTAK